MKDNRSIISIRTPLGRNHLRNFLPNPSPCYKATQGFTLIEVVLTLGILMVMVFGITQMMRSSFDLREGISQQSKVNRKLNRVMDQINDDLTHTFFVSNRDAVRTKHEQRTVFQILRKSSTDTLKLTTMSHRGRTINAKESDISYVVYEVRKSDKHPSRSHLYRGEFPRVPQDFKEDPKMEILAQDISSVTFEPWAGDDWSRNDWDSARSDTSNLIPHMVRVVIKAWSEESKEAVEPEGDQALQQLATVVYIPAALDLDELRQRISSFRL